jgi:hypothetical protein
VSEDGRAAVGGGEEEQCGQSKRSFHNNLRKIVRRTSLRALSVVGWFRFARWRLIVFDNARSRNQLTTDNVRGARRNRYT